MTQKTSTFIGISLLTILSFSGVFIGHVYFNIPMEVFPPSFGLLGLILVGIKRIFFKRELEPPPQPTNKDKLRAALALSAGLSAFTIIIGLLVGLNVFSYFEKIGKPRSIYEFDVYFILLLLAITIFYAKKRASIIRTMSNKEDAPDQKTVR